jgi:hypothetical protein
MVGRWMSCVFERWYVTLETHWGAVPLFIWCDLGIPCSILRILCLPRWSRKLRYLYQKRSSTPSRLFCRLETWTLKLGFETSAYSSNEIKHNCTLTCRRILEDYEENTGLNLAWSSEKVKYPSVFLQVVRVKWRLAIHLQVLYCWR